MNIKTLTLGFLLTSLFAITATHAMETRDVAFTNRFALVGGSLLAIGVYMADCHHITGKNDFASVLEYWHKKDVFVGNMVLIAVLVGFNAWNIYRGCRR